MSVHSRKSDGPASPRSPRKKIWSSKKSPSQKFDSGAEDGEASDDDEPAEARLTMDPDLAESLRKRKARESQEDVRFYDKAAENKKAEEMVQEKVVQALSLEQGQDEGVVSGIGATTKRSNVLLDAAREQPNYAERKESGRTKLKRVGTREVKRQAGVKKKWKTTGLKVVALNRVQVKEPSHHHQKGDSGHRQSSTAGAGNSMRAESADVLASSHTMMIENELLSLPMFAKCSQEFIKALSSVAKSHRFNHGNIIATQGNKGSSMIIVLRGVVEMLVEEDKVQTLSQGQYFGETLLLGLENHWTATLQVADPCVVCEITRDNYLQVMKNHPPDYAFDQIVAKNKDCLSDGTLVNTCVVFNGLSDTTMCQIDTNLVRRIIFPGETILHEGTPGDELYILVRGTAHVSIAGRLVRAETAPRGEHFAETETAAVDGDEEEEKFGHVTSISSKRGSKLSDAKANTGSGVVCFGELGLLGLQDRRTATVVAETVLHVRVLYRPVFRRILEEQSDSIGTSELAGVFQERYNKGSDESDRLAPAQFLRQVPIFIEVGCSGEFLDFLAEHLEDRIFMPGQKIIDENNPDDRCMYLIVDGLAKVVKNQVEVNVLSSGAVCGEINVLGLASKRTASVIAEQTCYLQVLHQSVVVRGLELFPEERKKVLMMAFKGYDKNQAMEAQKSDGGKTPRTPAEDSTPNRFSPLPRRSSISDTDHPMSRRASIKALDNCRGSRKTIVQAAGTAFAGSRRGSTRASVFLADPGSPGNFSIAEDSSQPDGGSALHGRLSHMRKSMENRTVMAQALQGSPLFADIGTNFIEELSLVATDRIYMPGDIIIKQGKKGDSMFVMVSGAAAVYATDERKTRMMSTWGSDDAASMSGLETGKPRTYVSRVGSLTGGSVGGELAMLGVSQTRSATIEAETICSMWEITQEEALPIIERFPDAMKHFANIIVEHLERTVPTRILSLPLFRGFDRKFRTLLGIYSERRAYFPGQTIVREGYPGERLYIMNLGRVRLEKKSVNVKMYASGSHFGSTVMLGIHKSYMATLIALQTCHLLAITRTAYQAALEQYPALGAAQEMCRSEKANEEVLREAVQRSATRKLIWKRYQLLVMDPEKLGPNPFGNKSSTSEKETLDTYCKAWHSLAKYLRERRKTLMEEKKRRIYLQKMWLLKRAEAMERARKRREEEQMDALPDYLRGGLSGSGAETGTVKLPLVPVPPGEAERKDLAAYLKDWPTPRPCPHYRLRVYGVLKEAVVTSPSEASPLLPLLKESQAAYKLGSHNVSEEESTSKRLSITARDLLPDINPQAHTQFASTCSCGNVFMDDALFCRKCGSKRQRVACSCGNVFMDDALFCRKCGSKRDSVPEDANSASAGLLGKAPRSIKEDHTLLQVPTQDVAETSGDALTTEEEDADEEFGDSGDEEISEHRTPLPSNGATPLPSSCAAEGSNFKLPPIHAEEYPHHCMTPPMSASSIISAGSGRGHLY